MDQQPDDSVALLISKVVPGVIVAVVGGTIPIGIAIVGFLWQQTVSLAKMNETLQMVCRQIEEKKAIDREQDRLDREQDRRLLDLEKAVARFKP